jgi:hypothetical protein
VVAAKHTRADDGDSNFVQNLTYHGNIGEPWRQLT